MERDCSRGSVSAQRGQSGRCAALARSRCSSSRFPSSCVPPRPRRAARSCATQSTFARGRGTTTRRRAVPRGWTSSPRRCARPTTRFAPRTTAVSAPTSAPTTRRSTRRESSCSSTCGCARRVVCSSVRRGADIIRPPPPHRSTRSSATPPLHPRHVDAPSRRDLSRRRGLCGWRCAVACPLLTCALCLPCQAKPDTYIHTHIAIHVTGAAPRRQVHWPAALRGARRLHGPRRPVRPGRRD